MMGVGTMTSSLEATWANFFITAAGASGALVGLVIVAVSVNVREILAHQQLPSRAGATIGALVLILVSSMFALVPQPLAPLGAEILASGLVAWLLQMWSAHQLIAVQTKTTMSVRQLVFGIAIGHIPVIPFLVGAILLFLGQSGGVYWVALGVVAVFAGSVLNTWILLVEILR